MVGTRNVFFGVPFLIGALFVSSAGKKKRGSIPANGPKEISAPLREFLDSCVIPTLVEKFFAKKEDKRCQRKEI